MVRLRRHCIATKVFAQKSAAPRGFHNLKARRWLRKPLVHEPALSQRSLASELQLQVHFAAHLIKGDSLIRVSGANFSARSIVLPPLTPCGGGHASEPIVHIHFNYVCVLARIRRGADVENHQWIAVHAIDLERLEFPD